MTDSTANRGAATARYVTTLSPTALVLILAIAAALAATFINRAVLHYLLDYSPASFGTYWPHSGRLLLHLSGGTVALVAGIFQLWSGLRMRWPRVHRWTGRVYLAGVAMGASAGMWLALTPSFGWIYGIALGGLAIAWAWCAWRGYRAIRARKLPLHRRWMIRAYVVTFAFVFYRVIEWCLFTAGVNDVPRVEIISAWGCWPIPLAVTILLQRRLDRSNA